MRRSLVGVTAAAGIALASSASFAQVPVSGLVACDRCTAVAQLPSATLFGFKLSSGNLDAAPDVLYDERPAGGARLDGATAPTLTDIQWVLPPNWRVPQLPIDVHVAIVLDAGTLAFDAGTPLNQDFTAILQQATCSFGGGVAPLVRDIPGGHAVEWNPVLEENPTDLIGGGGCTIGADAARGFVIGYNVYRLDEASFPAPTRRQFLAGGWVGHADVLRLDFNVPDPDGMSGSDLDPTDNLSLRNPDGMPDTGDEILVYADGLAGPGAHWYRLQPVVRGSQAFFETGLSGISDSPADRLDLDGDGSPESVDIGRDGFVEFIDPSGRGLGLTHGGEIASSYRPGLGIPPIGLMGCDGRPAAGGETDCANDLDDDGDGLVDCADPDCLFDPGCAPEDCANGLDDDGDGDVDCADPDCVADPACLIEDCANGLDDDGDGDVDCLDVDCCGDAACLAPPPDVARLDVAKPAIGSDDVVVTWAPAPPLRPAATYDVLSGCIARRPPLPGCLRQDRSIVAAGCQVDDAAGLSWRDSRPIDADVLGFYYLVREQAPCSVAGSYGHDSRGGTRAPGPGDCPR